jgi:hypothetical protein
MEVFRGLVSPTPFMEDCDNNKDNHNKVANNKDDYDKDNNDKDYNNGKEDKNYIYIVFLNR